MSTRPRSHRERFPSEAKRTAGEAGRVRWLSHLPESKVEPSRARSTHFRCSVHDRGSRREPRAPRACLTSPRSTFDVCGEAGGRAWSDRRTLASDHGTTSSDLQPLRSGHRTVSPTLRTFTSSRCQRRSGRSSGRRARAVQLPPTFGAPALDRGGLTPHSTSRIHRGLRRPLRAEQRSRNARRRAVHCGRPGPGAIHNSSRRSQAAPGRPAAGSWSDTKR
jgi:hypothetical protein